MHGMTWMALTPWTEQKTQTVALHIIATHGVSPAGPNHYRVRSQSRPGHAYLVAYAGVWACSCDFNQSTGRSCCHIEASRLFRRTGDPDQGVEPMTYRQAWSAYNAAQTAEVRLFDSLLADLVDSLPAEDGPRKRGNQPLPLREKVFVAVQKVYSQLSTRRAASLFGFAAERGHLDHAPHFNAPTKFLNDPATTPILRALVQQSALPLAGIEQDFAVDSTSFCTNVRGDYREERYGGTAERKWLKAHLCVGVNTHIVTDAIVTPSEGEGTGDTSSFAPLVRSLAGRFQVDEVSADPRLRQQGKPLGRPATRRAGHHPLQGRQVHARLDLRQRRPGRPRPARLGEAVAQGIRLLPPPRRGVLRPLSQAEQRRVGEQRHQTQVRRSPEIEEPHRPHQRATVQGAGLQPHGPHPRDVRIRHHCRLLHPKDPACTPNHHPNPLEVQSLGQGSAPGRGHSPR